MVIITDGKEGSRLDRYVAENISTEYKKKLRSKIKTLTESSRVRWGGVERESNTEEPKNGTQENKDSKG